MVVSVRLKDQLISNEHSKGLPLLSRASTTGEACCLSILLQAGARLKLQNWHLTMYQLFHQAAPQVYIA